MLIGDTLTITADIPAREAASIDLVTAWPILHSTNASVERIGPRLDRITFVALADAAILNDYQKVQAIFRLQR